MAGILATTVHAAAIMLVILAARDTTASIPQSQTPEPIVSAEVVEQPPTAEAPSSPATPPAPAASEPAARDPAAMPSVATRDIEPAPDKPDLAPLPHAAAQRPDAATGTAPATAEVDPQPVTPPETPSTTPHMASGFGERPYQGLARLPQVPLTTPEHWLGSDPATTYALLLPPTQPEGGPQAGRSALLRIAPVTVSAAGGAGVNYPRAAIANRLEGDVLLVVKVDTTGKVIAVTIAQSSGHRTLDAAAVEGAMHWRLRVEQYSGPGRIVDSISFEAPVRFRLP